MSFPEQDRAVQILEKEFGPRWKQIVQELGTKELRQRVGTALFYRWRASCSAAKL